MRAHRALAPDSEETLGLSSPKSLSTCCVLQQIAERLAPRAGATQDRCPTLTYDFTDHEDQADG